MKLSPLNGKGVLVLAVGLLFVSPMLSMKEPPGIDQRRNVRPQTAANPEQTVMNINNLTVWVREDGFHDRIVEGSWNGTFPKGTAGIIFSEGLVWGGKVNDGVFPRLRFGGSTHTPGNRAGAILTDELGNVTGSEDPEDPSVRPYRVRPDWVTADLSDDAANFFLIPMDEVSETHIAEIWTQYETDWNEWPAGKGAPHEEINGIPGYQPSTWNVSGNIWNTDGDIPGIPGAHQTLWVVYNDLRGEHRWGSPSIGLEVQETYWAYVHYRALDNVVFKRARIIYKGTWNSQPDPTIDSMYIAQWSDPDNGLWTNDYVGCDTLLDVGYVYDAYETDAVWNTWGLVPPAGGYVFLVGPLASTGQPSDSGWFDFHWKQGYQNLPMTTFTFLTYGYEPDYGYAWTRGIYNAMRGCEQGPPYPHCEPLRDDEGSRTYFELTGDPALGTGDLDGHPTPENPNRFPAGDRRFLMSSGPFSFAKGDTQEVVIALAGAFGINHLLSVAALKGYVAGVWQAWRSNFTQLGPGTRLVELEAPHNTEEIGPFTLTFLIEDDPSWEPDITFMKLHYSAGDVQDSVDLDEILWDDTTAYVAVVPAFSHVTGTMELHYHVSVDYEDGTRTLVPDGAPVNYGLMIFGLDTTGPVLTDLDSLPDVLYLMDDSARVTVKGEDDRFPMSVNLRWKINATGEVSECPMENSALTDPYYSGRKRLWIGSLAWHGMDLGDTLYYWVEAVDSSMNHNAGRSDLRWFVAREYEKIGNWDEMVTKGWDWGTAWHLGSSVDEDPVARLVIWLGDEIVGDTLTLLEPLNLAHGFPSLFLIFNHRHVFWDNAGYLEVKQNDRAWEKIREYTGNEGFYEQVVPLESYIGSDSFFIRFSVEREERMVSWYIDDIYLSIHPSILGIGREPSVLPGRYQLRQPYPNPFNPSTTIEFSMPKSGRVTLTVYDLLGREVETILNEHRDVGHHKVQWNASNVPSGIYFIRMQAGDSGQTKKIVLLK